MPPFLILSTDLNYLMNSNKMPRLHRINYPYFNQTLKEALLHHFHVIQLAWAELPPNKEARAPTRMKQVHWSIIKNYLTNIISQLRQLQPMEDLVDDIVPLPTDPIEVVFDRLINLWYNHVRVRELYIPDDHVDWALVNHTLRELHTQMCDIRFSDYILLHVELE